jgi:hypothetical protein
MHDRLRGLPVHRREQGLGFQPFGGVVHQSEIAQPGLNALGNRHLSGDAAKDELRRGVNPLAGQRVDYVVPSPRLDLIERLRRRGTAFAGRSRDPQRNVEASRLGTYPKREILASRRPNPQTRKTLRSTR